VKTKLLKRICCCYHNGLQNTGGKKVYGYLKADVKAIIDRIVDELAKEERVDKLYRAWNDWQNEILKTYTNKTAAPASSIPAETI
jgi:hypothetical protein